jgi:serine/threonine protein kinase
MKPANMLVLSLKVLLILSLSLPFSLPHTTLQQQKARDNNCIKLTDFGMSRESNSRATVVGDYVEGTVLYMAPEMLNKVQSERADTYSLGMCVWELITRKLPFVSLFLGVFSCCCCCCCNIFVLLL